MSLLEQYEHCEEYTVYTQTRDNYDEAWTHPTKRIASSTQAFQTCFAQLGQNQIDNEILTD